MNKLICSGMAVLLFAAGTGCGAGSKEEQPKTVVHPQSLDDATRAAEEAPAGKVQEPAPASTTTVNDEGKAAASQQPKEAPPPPPPPR